jgi:hypothetical protein
VGHDSDVPVAIERDSSLASDILQLVQRGKRMATPLPLALLSPLVMLDTAQDEEGLCRL